MSGRAVTCINGVIRSSTPTENLLMSSGLFQLTFRTGPCSAERMACTLSSPCDEHPGKPYFIKEKVGFAGHTLYFLFRLKHIDYGCSLKPPRRGGSNEHHQSMFRAKIRKISLIIKEKNTFLEPFKVALYCIGMLS